MKQAAVRKTAEPAQAHHRIAQSMVINDQSPAAIAQRQRMEMLKNSAHNATQQRNGALQRVEDEEPLQGKFEIAQRAEDEELLQGKFETAQCVEEEELLQGKFETAQCVEEEELLQGKFAAVQRMEEEEPLQAKSTQAASTQLAAQNNTQPNNTGLPDQLKAGIESLSGMSMDHVKVHYNSSQPAQLNAHAYAQGSNIHVAPGQERHLPHEAWHVVQQAQGRVKPTMQMKAGVPVNDDVSLETEADVMGAKAMNAAGVQMKLKATSLSSSTLQLRKDKRIESSARKHYADGWGVQYAIQDDKALKAGVSDGVQDSGEVSLGYHEKNRWEFRGDSYRNVKYCSIQYSDLSEGDGKYKSKYTSIYHCGPSGEAATQVWDGAKWAFE